MSKIVIDTSEITAKVYWSDASNTTHFVKVDIPSLGLHITSIKISPSVKFDEPMISMPGKKGAYGRWSKHVELVPSPSQFKDIVIDAVNRAVDAHLTNADVVIEDIPDEPITLEDIPF